MTTQHVKMLESEMMHLRISLEQFRSAQRLVHVQPTKDRRKLFKLFGAWDGEIETFLNEFYIRRERRTDGIS